MKYQSGKRLAQVKDAILRLVELHGRGITHESAVKLTLWSNPDGKWWTENLDEVLPSQGASPLAGHHLR